MNQPGYIEKILSKFGMADSKPRSNPCELDIKKTSDKFDLLDSKTYRKIIGSLIYIMVATRPNIFYTVTRLSQNQAKPNSFHLNKLKMHNHSITNIQEIAEALEIRRFCDEDWANSSDRKSVSGFCFRLAENDPMISWKSKKQNSVALSTCKVEFIAIS